MLFAFLKKAVFNWLWTVYSQNYAMFYNEPWRAILQGKQREPGAWVHANTWAVLWHPYEIMLTSSPLSMSFLCQWELKADRFFFFCTHLIKEKIRREVGAVTLQKPPSLEGNAFGIQMERIHNPSSRQL